MASILALTGGSLFNTTAGTKASAGGNPAVGDLLLVVTAHTGNTATVAPTDNNPDGLGTYTLVTTCVKAASADTMQAWVRNALVGSTTTTIVTHAPGTTTGGGFQTYRIAGLTRAGLSAIRQSAIQSNQAAAGTPTPVLGVAARTQNCLAGAVFNATNPATMTARSSPAWTELNDVGYTIPTTGLETASINSGETATSIAWGGTSASAFCSIVVEFETAPGPVIYPRLPTSKMLRPGTPGRASMRSFFQPPRTFTVAAAGSEFVTVATDTIALSDSAEAVTNRVAAATDSLSLSDSAVSVTTRTADATDAIALSDSAAAVSTLVAAAADTLTLTDAVDAVTSRVAAASDSITLTDVAVAEIAAGIVAVAADTITLADAAEAVTQRVAVASDAMALTDSAEAGLQLTADASDTVTLSDSAVASVVVTPPTDVSLGGKRKRRARERMFEAAFLGYSTGSLLIDVGGLVIDLVGAVDQPHPEPLPETVGALSVILPGITVELLGKRGAFTVGGLKRDSMPLIRTTIDPAVRIAELERQIAALLK